MSRKTETVAQKIEKVREMTPPPAHRKARKAFAAIDDFVAILGASRSRYYAWMDGAEPEEKFRKRLAKLSGGRYVATDFVQTQRESARLRRRVDVLEQQVERLERHIFGEDASQAQ